MIKPFENFTLSTRRSRWFELAGGGLPWLGVAFLLFLICHRVWDLGITHTDDATWLLRAFLPDSDPVGDWARQQGRLWPFIAGNEILYALRWQGTVWGEILRLGSFALYFASFFYAIRVYFGKRVALLSAVLCAGFFVQRWDGSILTTYPLITWPAGILFIAALLLGRQFIAKGNTWLLLPASVALFVALFNNEGVTATFALLAIASVYANHIQLQEGGAPGVRRRVWVLFSLFSGLCFAYAIAYGYWRLSHPTQYAGNSLAPFNLGRIAKTIANFSTASNVVHDIFKHYEAIQGDSIDHTAAWTGYALSHSWRAVLNSPIALIVGLITALTVGKVLRATNENLNLPSTGTNKQARGSTAIVILGLVIAILPIAPVALTTQYQTWVADLHVQAYSHSLFCHFGLSVTLAGCLIGWNEHFSKGRWESLFQVFAIASSSVLAALAFSTSNVIADDMRVVAGRWRVLEQVNEIAQQVFPGELVYMPQLADGGQYGVVNDDYWGQYLKAKLQSSTRVTANHPSISDELRGLLNVRYAFVDGGRNLIGLVTEVKQLAENPDMRAQRAVVFVEKVDANLLAQYRLSYRDQQGTFAYRTLSQLPFSAPGKPHTSLIILPHAIASSIRIERIPDQAATPGAAENSLIRWRYPSGRAIDFGNALWTSDSQRDTILRVLGSQWHANESSGVWSKGEHASLKIPQAWLYPQGSKLHVDGSTCVGLGMPGGEQLVTVRFGEQQLARWTFTLGKPPAVMEIVLPPHAGNGQDDIELDIDIAPSYRPNAMIQSPDTRDLGFLLRSIVFEPLP